MSPRALNTVARRGVACLLVAWCVSGIAACGSDSRDSQRLLGQALHPAQRLHSGRVTLAVTLGGVAGSAITVRLAGAFVAAAAGQLPNFDLDITVGHGAVTQPLGATFTGGRLFVRVARTSYLAPAPLLAQLRQSYGRAATPAGRGEAASSIDPLRWLTNPTRVGTTVLDGVKTAHIRTGLDVGHMSADLRRLQAQVGPLAALVGVPPSRLPEALTQRRADVYLGLGDHLLRELSVRAGGSVPVNVTLSFSQLNQPQPLAAPARARPLSSLLGAGTYSRPTS